MSEEKDSNTKQPFYKKWWFWAIVLAIVVIGVVGSSGTQNNSKTNTDTATVENQDQNENNSAQKAEPKPTDNATTEQKNALKKAESYAKNMHMSKQGVYDQLTSEYGEGFSTTDAQWAVDHLEGVDWNKNALEKGKTYYKNMSMAKNKVYDQLTSEFGEKFTPEEAQYAVDHLDD